MKDTTAEMREGCYDVSKTALELEKDRKERLARKAEDEQRRREEGTAAEPVKRKKSGSKEKDDDDDEAEKDEDYVPEDEDKPVTKKPKKTTSLQSVIAPDAKEYRTTAADRQERRKQRSGDEQELPDLVQEEETEDEKRKRQLEREIKEQQKEIKRMERKKQHEAEECSKQKAIEFQKVIQTGAWMKDKDKKPKIVSAEKRKKTKGFTSTSVATGNDDEEDEEEDEDVPPIPEGFHLLSDDMHCKNIRQADGFQHYVRAICHQFEPIVKKAGNVQVNYSKLIQSIYWACQAVGISSIKDADVDAVLQNIKDLTCRAWMLHLRGIKEATPFDLLPAARKESFITKGAPLEADIEKLLKEEVEEMTPLQENTTRNLLKELCYHNKMAHRHAMEAAERLESLSMNVSIPFFLKIAESTNRALVQVRLPSMDEHMDETEKMKKSRDEEFSAQLRPTIDIAADMNLVSMNEEWNDSKDGRATRILAAFVNRYLYEQMHAKDGKVLSARVLGDKFNLKESTLGKMLNARRYLGGKEAMLFKKRRLSTKGDGDETVSSSSKVMDHDEQ